MNKFKCGLALTMITCLSLSLSAFAETDIASSSQDTGYKLIEEASGDNLKLTVLPTINSIETLNAAKERQDSIIESKKLTRNADIIQMLDDAESMITFTQPLTVEELDDLLSASGAQMQLCTIKYTDASGMRVTGWTNDLSQANLDKKLEHLNSIHDTIVMDGIVSASVKISVNDDAYDILKNDENVLFVDLSETIIRIQEEDFGKDLKVMVCDLSWDLDKFN